MLKSLCRKLYMTLLIIITVVSCKHSYDEKISVVPVNNEEFALPGDQGKTQQSSESTYLMGDMYAFMDQERFSFAGPITESLVTKYRHLSSHKGRVLVSNSHVQYILTGPKDMLVPEGQLELTPLLAVFRKNHEADDWSRMKFSDLGLNPLWLNSSEKAFPDFKFLRFSNNQQDRSESAVEFVFADAGGRDLKYRVSLTEARSALVLTLDRKAVNANKLSFSLCSEFDHKNSDKKFFHFIKFGEEVVSFASNDELRGSKDARNCITVSKNNDSQFYELVMSVDPSDIEYLSKLLLYQHSCQIGFTQSVYNDKQEQCISKVSLINPKLLLNSVSGNIKTFQLYNQNKKAFSFPVVPGKETGVYLQADSKYYADKNLQKPFEGASAGESIWEKNYPLTGKLEIELEVAGATNVPVVAVLTPEDSEKEVDLFSSLEWIQRGNFFSTTIHGKSSTVELTPSSYYLDLYLNGRRVCATLFSLSSEQNHNFKCLIQDSDVQGAKPKFESLAESSLSCDDVVELTSMNPSRLDAYKYAPMYEVFGCAIRQQAQSIFSKLMRQASTSNTPILIGSKSKPNRGFMGYYNPYTIIDSSGHDVAEPFKTISATTGPKFEVKFSDDPKDQYGNGYFNKSRGPLTAYFKITDNRDFVVTKIRTYSEHGLQKEWKIRSTDEYIDFKKHTMSIRGRALRFELLGYILGQATLIDKDLIHDSVLATSHIYLSK